MRENSGLYREKSMERISSPEKLNDYMCVTTPSVWLLLAAVAALLLGFLAWCAFGRMEVRLPVGAEAAGGVATVYLPAAEVSKVRAGTPLRIDGQEYPVTAVSRLPVLTDDSMDPLLLQYSGVETDEPVYVLTVRVRTPDGLYAAELITERIEPLSFLDRAGE